MGLVRCFRRVDGKALTTEELPSSSSVGGPPRRWQRLTTHMAHAQAPSRGATWANGARSKGWPPHIGAPTAGARGGRARGAGRAGWAGQPGGGGAGGLAAWRGCRAPGRAGPGLIPPDPAALRCPAPPWGWGLLLSPPGPPGAGPGLSLPPTHAALQLHRDHLTFTSLLTHRLVLLCIDDTVSSLGSARGCPGST